MRIVSARSGLRTALLLTLLGAAACSRAPDAAPANTPKTPAAPAHQGGIDLAGMDRSVAPGDDFFAYANGAWAKTAEIPPDRSTWGVWAIVNDRAQQRTRELLEGLTAPGGDTSADTRKVADYFASYMDDAAIESMGLSPVQPFLSKIAAIRDREALAAWVCGSLRSDVDPLNAANFYTDHLFGVWISPALDDPETYVPYLLQGGLGMPDRDYYLKAGRDMERVRGAYREHVLHVL